MKILLKALLGLALCATPLLAQVPVTGAGGSGAFTGGTAGTSYQDITESAAPGNPSAGTERCWTDSTAHQFKCKDSSGSSTLPSGGNVSNNTDNTYTGTHTQDFSAAGQTVKLPSASGKTLNAYISADVSVCHRGGGCQSYPASADTDAARGTALLTAAAALVDGDTIVLACQTNGKKYNIGTSLTAQTQAYIDLSIGATGTANLVSPFCGQDQAYIYGQVTAGQGGNNATLVSPGLNGSYIGYVTINGNTPDDTTSSNWTEPFGLGSGRLKTDRTGACSNDANCYQASNVTLDNVHIIGQPDGIIWFAVTTSGITVNNSLIETTYDQIAIGVPTTGAGTATGYVRVNDTRILCTPDTYSQCNAIKPSTQLGALHTEFVIDLSNVTMIDTGTINLTNIVIANGVTVNFRSGKLDTTGASGTFKAVANSNSGVMNVYPNTSFDHSKTAGTITYLDIYGNNAVFAGTLAVTGHDTLEGVTSTGATGTGKHVYDTSPTISGHPTVEGVTSTGATGTGKFVFDTNPTVTGATVDGVTPTVFGYLDPTSSVQTQLNGKQAITTETAVTNVAMSQSVNTVLTGPTTLIAAPGSDRHYVILIWIVPRTNGTGGTCAAGTVGISLGFKDAGSGSTLTVGTGSTSYENIFFSNMSSTVPSQALGWSNSSPAGAAGTVWTPLPRYLFAGSGTAVTYQVWQVAASNCTTTQQTFDVHVAYADMGY